MLSGREVCVMNGAANLPKTELERKVVEMGGTFVQNPGQFFCVFFLNRICLVLLLYCIDD